MTERQYLTVKRHLFAIIQHISFSKSVSACDIRDIFQTKADRGNVILATYRQTLKRRAPGKHHRHPHSAEAGSNYSCYILIYFKQLRSMYIYSCSWSLITARVARRAAMFSSLSAGRSVCLSVSLFVIFANFTFFVLFVCLLFHNLSSSLTLPYFVFVLLFYLFCLFVSLFAMISNTIFFHLYSSVFLSALSYLPSSLTANKRKFEYTQPGLEPQA